MKFYFLLFFLSFASSSYIETVLPIGPISNHPIYGPLNYTVSNMKLSFIDPGVGLENVTHFRILDVLPQNFPFSLRGQLVSLLKSASTEEHIRGEILVITGNSKCGQEVRLVTLSDGNFDFLLPSVSPTNKPRCCSDLLNGHYGTQPCTGQNKRTVYVVSSGLTLSSSWISGAESSSDPALNSFGVHQAELVVDNLKNKIDLVIGSPHDASSITGAVIASKLNTNLMISDVLGSKCGLRYEMWRLFKETPLILSAPTVLDLLGGLSSEITQVILVMDPCSSSTFAKSIGYNSNLDPGSILEIQLFNSTGFPYWESSLTYPGSTSYSDKCSSQCDSHDVIDVLLVEGTDIDYSISRTELAKLSPIEQANYVRLRHERSIWANVYWQYRHLFKDKILYEKNGVRYWGRFAIPIEPESNQIGRIWFELLKGIWKSGK